MSVDWVNIGSGDDEECVLRPVIHYLNQFDQQDHTSVKFELNNKFLKKIPSKISTATCRPFCAGVIVLMSGRSTQRS